MKKSCTLLALTLLTSINLFAQSWATHTPNFPDTIGIADIEVVNENVIWAVGYRYGVNDSFYYYGYANETYFALSVDGGATWKTGTIPLGENPFIANMTATDAGTALIIGLENFGNAKTLKTIDGGDTWQITQNNWDPALSWPDYIHAFGPAKMCVIGDPRNNEFEIYNTFNAGQVWQIVPGSHIPDPLSGEFGFNNCGASVGNNIWFGTNMGRVFHSSNGGLDWNAAQTPVESAGIMAFSDANNGIVSSGYGLVPVSRLCTTIDGGAFWTELNNLPYAGSFNTYGIAYVPNQPFLLLGLTHGGILSGSFETWISPDRGDTWQQISTGEIIGWPTFISSTVGWAGEFQQLSHPTRLYNYTGSPLVGLFSPETLTAEISLSPNPASDFLQVKVQAQESGDFWILLNDSQGHLVRKETVSNVSTFEKGLEINSIPCGNYSVTVCTAKGSVTRQFVKIL